MNPTSPSFFPSLLSQVIFSLGIGGLTFLWRFLLSGLRKKILVPGYDTIGQLYYFKKVNQSGNRRIKRDEQFTVDPQTYRPQFFYQFLGLFFTFNRLSRHHHRVNPVLDSVFAMALFNLALVCFSRYWGYAAAKSQLMALVVTLLYMLSPVMVCFHERAAHFGERLFSYILGMGVLIVTFLMLNHHAGALSITLIFFTAAVALTLAVIYTSQFTLQAVILLQLLASLFTRSPLPALSLLIALGLVLILDRQWFMTYLRAKVFHFKTYHRLLKAGTYSLDLLYRHFWKKLVIHALPLGMLLFFSNDIAGGTAVEKHLIYYCAASLLVVIVVYLPFFRPVGEAIRYLEYAIPFALILLVHLCFQAQQFAWLVVLFIVNLFFYIHYTLQFNLSSGQDDQLFDMLEVLKHHPPKPLLPIPFKLSYFLATYLDNPLIASLVPRGDVEKISTRYNYPIPDLEKINALYPFDLIVYQKTKGSSPDSYDFSSLEILYQNNDYILFKKSSV